MLQKLVFVFVLLSHGELFMNKLAVSCIEQIKNSLYSLSRQTVFVYLSSVHGLKTTVT